MFDKKHNKAIIIFGLPGAGKGVASDIIKSTINSFHVSMGEVIRKTASEEQKERINQGNLLSDESVVYLFEKYLNNERFSENSVIILDGIPRTVFQVDYVNKSFDVIGSLYIKVDENVAVARLIKRKQEQGRKDDEEAVIKKRMKINRSVVEDILKRIQEVGIVVTEVNGDVSKENMSNNISNVVKKIVS